MRDIKFRIYNNKRNEWVHDTAHAVNLLGETIILGEILRCPDDSIIDLSEVKDLVVMQYTGLEDKNGKEIYEGDVLAIDETKEPWFKVEWNDQYACFGVNHLVNGPLFGGIDGKWVAKKYEVIGNIYEHPHLLQETTQKEGEI